MSKGAEAAAVTLSVMGFIALIVGALIFFRRRRKRNQSASRHAEDAFNPNNNGSLQQPEIAHVTETISELSGDSISRRSYANSASLYGGASYARPETASTNPQPSRPLVFNNIVPPQPTPNPFADPPRNKAYDQLRGRPVSSTLTDRGSWAKNPFKDPESERFDPFGELQEKARQERKRYVAEARREAEEKRRRGKKNAEKANRGLAVPGSGMDDRKGSDATVGGLGVLDRTESGRYR